MKTPKKNKWLKAIMSAQSLVYTNSPVQTQADAAKVTIGQAQT